MPKTYEASKYLRGQNAVWCTGRHNDDSYWKSYNKDSDLIIFINKKDRDTKYQGAFYRTDKYCHEFRDADNSRVDFEKFLAQNNAELLKFAEKNPYLNKIKDVKEAGDLFDYAAGKPFVYTGQEVPTKLKAFLSKVEFKDNKLIAGLFEDCENLKEITLPEGTELIPSDCFNGCSSLEKVVLPNTVTKIEALAFNDCKNLKQINLPESLKEIGIYAFKNCDNIILKVKRGTKFSVKLLDGPFIKEHLQ